MLNDPDRRESSSESWPPHFDPVAFGQAADDFKSVYRALEADLLRSAGYAANNHGDQFHRRALVRALFAHVEATLFHMKRLTLLGDTYFLTDNLTDVEKAALSETSFDVTRAGKVREQDRGIPLRSNLRLAFRYYCRLFVPNWSPDIQAPGWKDLLTAIGIRNRVTHPKTTESIHITDEEYATVTSAQAWWRLTLKHLFEELGQRGGNT